MFRYHKERSPTAREAGAAARRSGEPGLRRWPTTRAALLAALGSLLLAACAGAGAAESKASEASTAADPAASSTEGPMPMDPEPNAALTVDPNPDPPTGAESQFSTDFSLHSVDYAEILSGGPPKDGIPAVDEPKFINLDEADEWLEPQEPVIVFEEAGDARAYPLQILTWHEIVNDVVGGRPVTITFCPLCNTAIAFDRTVDGQVVDFGTTGRLRFSNLIMYDRQTETWWQQASGEAIVGELTGTQLEFLPAPILAWEEFQRAYPLGSVLSRETGYFRSYGQNPYPGYDDVRRSPFLYIGPRTPDQLPAMARVLTVDLSGEAVAFPYDTLEERRVANETVGDQQVVVFWQPGTASALDTSALAEGRDVGSAVAYSRDLDGQTLTFEFDGSAIVDRETGSEWDLLGQAVSGELAGASLEKVVAVDHFWFSWAAFKPETRIYLP